MQRSGGNDRKLPDRTAGTEAKLPEGFGQCNAICINSETVS